MRRLTPRVLTLCCSGGLLVALMGCGPDSLSVPAPTPATAAIATPAIRPLGGSVVDAPIRYALEPALAALETAVPMQFGDIARRITLASSTRQKIAFAATRTPFQVAFDGRQLTVSSTISYQGRGWYNPPIGPTVSSSCGTDGQKPRVRIVVVMDVALTPEWVLKTRSRLPTVRPLTETPRDACRVTFLKIDVTDRVVGTVRTLLERRLPMIDRQIAAFDVRSRMERWYNVLNRGIRVRDSVWLMLTPKQLRLGGLRLDGEDLVADVRLYAQPVLFVGAAPPSLHTALPPLDRAIRDVGDSAHLRVHTSLSYAAASNMLSRQLLGRSVRRFGRSLRLSNVRVYPHGDGRLVLAVGVAGDIIGNAYFVGTPRLDTVTRTLTVPDLDFDVATSDALVRGLAWLKKANLVTQLRQRAQLPLDSLIETTRAQLDSALNRTLAPGVRLTGHIVSGRLVDVIVEPSGLSVRAEATGTLGLQLDREIDVPRRQRGRRRSAATP